MANTDEMRFGFKVGLGLLMFGALILGLHFLVLWLSDRYFPKVAIVAMAALLAAPVFFLFPGRPHTDSGTTASPQRTLQRAASTIVKVVWVLWCLAAVVGAFFVLDAIHPGFLRNL